MTLTPRSASQRLQFSQEFFFPAAQLGGHNHLHDDVFVTPAMAVQAGNALACDAEDSSCLSPFRDIQFEAALKTRHIHLTSEGRCSEAYLLLKIDIIAMPFKDGISLCVNHDVEVTGQIVSLASL